MAHLVHHRFAFDPSSFWIFRAASGEGRVHMAWSFVVHKYLHKVTKWFLTSCGRRTISDAKIPRQAAMSGLVRVVNHII